jgi:hypothetical protein
VNEFRAQEAEESEDDAEYYVYEESLLVKLIAAAGWLVGWTAYWLAKAGCIERAESLIDNAIVMRRANPGAIRAIGYLNGRRGLRARHRGALMIHGRIHDAGPFANKGFFATYHVAAPNKMRALALIKRFEWDAIPESLEIEDGELDLPDEGAEGVLWVAPGRTFHSE